MVDSFEVGMSHGDCYLDTIHLSGLDPGRQGMHRLQKSCVFWGYTK